MLPQILIIAALFITAISLLILAKPSTRIFFSLENTSMVSEDGNTFQFLNFENALRYEGKEFEKILENKPSRKFCNKLHQAEEIYIYVDPSVDDVRSLKKFTSHIRAICENRDSKKTTFFIVAKREHEKNTSVQKLVIAAKGVFREAREFQKKKVLVSQPEI